MTKVMKENTCVYEDIVNPVGSNRTNSSVERLHFSFVIFLLC